MIFKDFFEIHSVSELAQFTTTHDFKIYHQNNFFNRNSSGTNNFKTKKAVDFSIISISNKYDVQKTNKLRTKNHLLIYDKDATMAEY